MTRFCYIGHRFHQQTKSTVFLKDILRRLGEVFEFSSSPDDPETTDNDLLRVLVNEKFDCYVFLQTEYLAKKISSLNLGKFVIVPMYDGAIGRDESFWQSFVDAQFISFSRAHHELLQSLNCKTSHFRYFPDVPNLEPNTLEKTDRSGFFWERRPDKKINFPLVARICRLMEISDLHVHRAGDFSDTGIYDFDHEKFRPELNITSSVWLKSKNELDSLVSRSTYYFAPRLTEGIGMSFLEAMARGQIVIGPDFPTMNEYVCHGVTGVLYNPDNPQINFRLDGEGIRTMRMSVYQKALDMRREWENDIPRLESLLRSDGKRWPTRDYSSHFVAALRKSASEKLFAI